MNLTGQHLRQLRREQNKTQTALGGKRYSKSYVSAVEKGRISPSSDALQYFAEQLDRPVDYFFTLLNDGQRNKTLAQFDAPGSFRLNAASAIGEESSFLDMLLQHAELPRVSSMSEWAGLPPEILSQLSLENRGHYHYLLGMIRQQDGQYMKSIEALEAALIYSPQKRRALILDELGTSHYLQREYQTALDYHTRALDALNDEHPGGEQAFTDFKIELHCANDYLATSDYQHAYEHFERARAYMNAQQDMQSAASLYWGLGYSLYALAHQLAALVSPENAGEVQTIEQRYQRAISFLLQSRSIYQISGDHTGEARVRLTLIMVSLDLSDFFSVLYRKSSTRSKASASSSYERMNSLLHDAAEQCRQIMMNWREAPGNADVSPTDNTTTLSFALAYIVRVLVRQAAAARVSGNTSTAFRNRATAAYLSQLTLDALFEGKFTDQLAHKADSALLPDEPGALQFVSLPRLPSAAMQVNMSWCPFAGLGEIYFAAGEVAEEFGRSATNQQYASSCYDHADLCFQTALDLTEKAEATLGEDAGYMLRSYQRRIAILEERLAFTQDQDASSIQALLRILNHALFQLQSRFFLIAH